MAQIWKPPDVAEPDAESHLSQEILYFTVPSCSSGRLRRALLALLASVAVHLRLHGSCLVIICWQGLLLHLREEGIKGKKRKGSECEVVHTTTFLIKSVADHE